MITPRALLDHATVLLWNDDAISARRAISASYYALFHLLTMDAASIVAGRQSRIIQARIRRGAQHKEMRRVCETIATMGSTIPRSLDGVLTAPVSPSLMVVADAFVRLQEARHTADYDIDAELSIHDAEAFRDIAEDAFERWDVIRDEPNAWAFLTALLLADRWTRRG